MLTSASPGGMKRRHANPGAVSRKQTAAARGRYGSVHSRGERCVGYILPKLRICPNILRGLLGARAVAEQSRDPGGFKAYSLHRCYQYKPKGWRGLAGASCNLGRARSGRCHRASRSGRRGHRRRDRAFAATAQRSLRSGQRLAVTPRIRPNEAPKIDVAGRGPYRSPLCASASGLAQYGQRGT